ncbi:MAG: amidohydrolase family protein [Pseudomonadales bacterium]
MTEPAFQVDAHQHFWRLDRGDYAWLTPELGPLYRDYQPADLAPLLRERNITSTVLVQAAPTVAETRYLLELAHANEFIGAVVGWIDMASSQAPELLAELDTYSVFRGVRPMIQDIDDADWILDPRLSPAFHTLVELDLRFDALVQPRHLPNLLKLLERHQDLRVVIDHAGKPDIAGHGLAAWRNLIRPLAAHTSARCKLSGLVTEAAANWREEDIRPYADELLAQFGPERLMWGSDWPVVNLAGGFDSWCRLTDALLADCSDAERTAILGGTAAAFYDL